MLARDCSMASTRVPPMSPAPFSRCLPRKRKSFANARPFAVHRSRGRTLCLTRECDQAVVAAAIAVDPDETSGEHAAVEERAQLSLHESRDRSTLLTCMGEEQLELLPNDFVEQRLPRLVALVLCHADPVGTEREFGERADRILEPIASDRRRSPAAA